MIATAQPDDFLLTEPDPVYRQKAAHNLSSHALAEFRKCPQLYRKRQLGLVRESESSAFLLGRAAHCLILEGRDTYDAGFAVGGPINERTGKPYGRDTKAFNQWAAELGKPVLSFDQAALIDAMAGGVADHPLAKSLLTDGQAEGVVRLPYGGHDCQGRFDWFSHQAGLVDLKTCDDLTWFESDARRFGYAYQLAFYRALIREACGETPPVHIIAVEKREPYRCGVWRIADEVLDQAERENLAAMRRLEQCQKTDTWPTGYQVIEGDHKGRKLWSRHNLEHPNAQTVQIAQGELSAICRAVGVMTPQDSAELHNLPLTITVKVTARSDTGEPTNEISAWTSKAAGQDGDGKPVQANSSTPPWARR